jgi:hypothetical protein
MAITSNTINVVEIPTAGADWVISMSSEDISGGETLKAAVAGSSHYIKRLMVRADAAMDITIGSGEADGAVTTIHIGPVPLDAASGYFPISFGNKGMKCTSGATLTIDSTAAGTVWIYAEGRTCKD